MKLVTFKQDDQCRLGVVLNDRVYDLRVVYDRLLQEEGCPQAADIAAIRFPSEMTRFIEGGEKALDAARVAVEAIAKSEGKFIGLSLNEIKLEAPLIPKTIICGGANFYDHLDETKRSVPTEVEFFLKSPHAVIGPGEQVNYDLAVTHKYDYEVELGIIIGKPARFVKKDDALDYVFGYTLINDISARSRQVIPWAENIFMLRFGEGKSYDTGAPIGPWILTRDEVPQTGNLQLRTYINNELRQNNNMCNIIWDVPSLISYYSKFMTLQPGFLIASGTPGGPALGSDIELGADPYTREDGVQRGGYLEPGDEIRIEIERIGVLINRVGN